MIKELSTIVSYKQLWKYLALICVFTIFASFSPVTQVSAEEGVGTAFGITTKEKDLQNGQIISSTKDGYKRTTAPYDPYLFGVVTMNPAIYFEDESNPNATPVISSGKVYVLVSTKNGSIKKGDYVTSSEIPGVGQKATENGTVLGTAEEDYTEKNPQKHGLVLVTLNPHFAQLSTDVTRNLFKAGYLGATAAFQSPLGALRYIVAGFIVLISFFLGFRYFGKASHSGVEAIGRNPLAGKLILLSVGMNVAITIGVMLFGVAIAYFILVL